VSERKGQTGGSKGSNQKPGGKKPEAAKAAQQASKAGVKPSVEVKPNVEAKPNAEVKPAPKAAPPQVKSAPADGAAEPGVRRAFKRTLVGRVKSDKMDKTVVVEVVRSKMDPVYKKYVRVRKSYKAHDEENTYKVGDRVEIIEHRPLSKLKRWKVINLVERAVQE
jgi:small subunit ribosomal protein S17